MGESVAEATLTAWLKEVGDTVEMDEAVLEIATDKVDSEVPSEVEGVLLEKFFEVDDVIKVGETIAIIQTNGALEDSGSDQDIAPSTATSDVRTEVVPETVTEIEDTIKIAKDTIAAPLAVADGQPSISDRFYSPLVKNIAKAEGISMGELDSISGTGKEGRVTKNDILAYVKNRQTGEQTPSVTPVNTPIATTETVSLETPANEERKAAHLQTSHGDEVIEMTRMGKLIAKHMVDSVSTSAHVQSFIEVDVTKIVNWRAKHKDAFEKREGEKLTYTPIFMEAIAKALKAYPLMNISVEGDRVIKKKNINIGMAAALPDGNLIVPVIKNADQLNLVGMAKVVNDLAERARKNALKPDEIQDGTYTVTNVGTFGSVFGTPIINQPQVGILALGAIRKVPSVIETSEGDFIGIRSKMYLSHSYDHRVVNGALGSMFAKAVADYLEGWDVNREI